MNGLRREEKRSLNVQIIRRNPTYAEHSVLQYVRGTRDPVPRLKEKDEMKCLILLVLLVAGLFAGACGVDMQANNSSVNANSVRPTQTPAVNAVNTNIPANVSNTYANGYRTPRPLPTPTPASTPATDKGLFSFPPPRGTGYTLLKSEDLQDPAGPTTFAFVSRKIAAGLEEAGYMPEQQFAYFWNERDEFAIVTAMERIEPDGTPLPDFDERWDATSNLPSAHGTSEYFRYLFRGKAVYYRVFAFIVTSKHYGNSLKRNSPPDFDTAVAWTGKGEPQLGSGEGDTAIESAIFDAKYRCYAVIYLFVNHTSIDGPTSVDALKGSDGRLGEGLNRDADIHLAKSNINIGGTRDEP